MTGAQPVVFLHIGAMKTGTTFLQSVMGANRSSLLEAGYLFPGGSWAEQVMAARDVLGRQHTLSDPRLLERCAGKWAKVTTEMLEHRGGPSVFSMEFLSHARKKEAARIVDSFPGAEVHVVITVRDAAGALPAQWQTFSRNGGTLSWPDFVRGARAVVRQGPNADAPAAKTFRRTQGIARMLVAWKDWVPPERLHVVTVPPAGADEMLLWQRFAEVIGVDPDVATARVERANVSLGQASADLIRRVNQELGKVPYTQYAATLKSPLATTILSQRASLETRAQLDVATRRFAATWNRRVRRAIVASGADVVGDLDDLPARVPEGVKATLPDHLTDPPAQELLAAAATARDGLLDLAAVRAERLAGVGVPVEWPTAGDVAADRPTSATRWATATDPVKAAVREIADLARRAIDLRNRFLAAPRPVDGELSPPAAPSSR